MSGRLEGKVAVVTGGASGLGEATVRVFVREGARVVIADVQEGRGERLAEDLGDAVRYQHTDVTREDEIAAVVDTAVSEFGRLDCMFNNAGIIGAVGPIDAIPIEEYDITMTVNVRGVFLGMKHAARVMKPQRSGSILSTSSTAGVMGGLGPHVYATAKSAIIGMTRNVAAELARFGIRVNCIAPAGMATPMAAHAMAGDPGQVSTVARTLAETSPLPGRPGLPQDIAHAALFLASDEGAFVSGHTLLVDAGLTVGSGNQMAPIFFERSPLFREAGQRGVPGR